jgi:hypothetical protein
MCVARALCTRRITNAARRCNIFHRVHVNARLAAPLLASLRAPAPSCATAVPRCAFCGAAGSKAALFNDVRVLVCNVIRVADLSERRVMRRGL